MMERSSGGWVREVGISVGLLLAVFVAVVAAVVATMSATGATLQLACLAVGPGLGWGGLAFSAGWWLGTRRRERVGAEVGAVLSPMFKELKHLRAALARCAVDESAKTAVHPRRTAPAADEAPTMVASYEPVREVVR